LKKGNNHHSLSFTSRHLFKSNEEANNHYINGKYDRCKQKLEFKEVESVVNGYCDYI